MENISSDRAEIRERSLIRVLYEAVVVAFAGC